MTRKKVALQYIANDASRKATFKKRRKGLLKKAHELATLCDVKACLVLYGQNEPEPVIWPSIPEAAHILAALKRMPEMVQSKKMMNQEAFTRTRISKMEDQLGKLDRENREMEAQTFINDCLMGRKTLDGVDGEKEMMSIGWMVEMNLNDLKRRKEEQMKAKEEKGKAVVTAMEEVKGPKWIPDYITPLNGNSNNNVYYDHFAMPPVKITEPVGSSGTNHIVYDHFAMPPVKITEPVGSSDTNHSVYDHFAMPPLKITEPVGSSDTNHSVYDHFDMPPLEITEPLGSSGTNNVASNPWMNYFSMN